MNSISGKTIAITGGTGTIGNCLVEYFLSMDNPPAKIAIYSRSESKQAEMKRKFPEYPQNIMRYYIGDIRDKNRLEQAFKGVDIVIHAAALKRVEECEYNPYEAIQTNIIGTYNVCIASINCGVTKVLYISTDKAVAPTTLYGATKMVGERCVINSNSYGQGKTIFACVRYANVIRSNGSVFELWDKFYKAGKSLPITDKNMSRMWLSKMAAVKLIVLGIDTMSGLGEIFVPYQKGERLVDTVYRCYNGSSIEYVGVRPGEKLHEDLITEKEAQNIWDTGKHLPGENGNDSVPVYCIFPENHPWISDENLECNIASKKWEKLSETTRITSKVKL